MSGGGSQGVKADVWGVPWEQWGGLKGLLMPICLMPMCDLDFSCGQAGGWEDESGVIHEVLADLKVDGGLYW